MNRARADGAEGICLGLFAVAGFAEDGVVRVEALSEVVSRYGDAGIEVPVGHIGPVAHELMLGDSAYEGDYGKILSNLERMAEAGSRVPVPGSSVPHSRRTIRCAGR